MPIFKGEKGKGIIRLVKARCGPFTLERQGELAAGVFQLYKSLRVEKPA
jgi:hypothetical protein